MPSPFPGMDPYLEAPAHWPGVHQSLITYIRDALQPLVRPKYRATIGERVYVMPVGRFIYPDAAVRQAPGSRIGETLAVERPTRSDHADRPYLMRVADDPVREPFVEIIDAEGDAVVTIIEVLSPANKAPGEGRQQYRRKQGEVLASAAHLVEIDLLGGGEHTVAVPRPLLENLPPWRYLVCVSRHPDRGTFEVYPAALADRLPRPAIPLRAPDADVALDLPALFAQAYDNGGYGDDIDYGSPPAVALSPEDRDLAARLLGGEGWRVALASTGEPAAG